MRGAEKPSRRSIAGLLLCASVAAGDRRGRFFLSWPPCSCFPRHAQWLPEMPEPASAETRNSRALAALRIGVGLFFLNFSESKVFGTQSPLPAAFQFLFTTFLPHVVAYP